MIKVDCYRRRHPKKNTYVFIHILLYVSERCIDSINTTVFVSNLVFMTILLVDLFQVWHPSIHIDKFTCTFIKREMSAPHPFMFDDRIRYGDNLSKKKQI